MMARIETAMHEYTGSYALRLRVDDYYGQIASFDLVDRMLLDDPDSARKRRRGSFTVDLGINLVREVAVTEFKYPVQLDISVIDVDLDC